MAYNPLVIGGGVEATAQRVTIASDSTGVVSVDDNGGSLTVDASSLPLPTGASTSANQATIIGHVDGIEGLLTTIDADTGGIATSTASIDTKTPALGQALASGSVPVVLTAAQVSTLTPPAAITGFATEATLGSVKTAVETIDNAVSGAGFNITQLGGANVPIGAGLEATAVRVTLPTDGTGLVTVKQSTASNLLATVNNRDGAGNALTSNSTTYTAKFAQDANVLGTLGTAFSTPGKVDVKGADGDVFVRQSTATNLKTQAENYQGGTAVGAANPLQVSLANTGANATAVKVDGSAVTQPVSYATTGSGTSTGAVRVELPTNGTGTLATVSTVTTLTTLTGGGVAHDGVDSGNPIKIGARATNAEIAAVANNDRSDLVTTLTGKLITFPFTNPENIVSGVTSAMTGTTSTSVIAAPAAGLRNYITQITVGNSHATVGTFVNIQDGSGGTTIWTIPAAAVYGGATINFDPPLRQPTTATALYCACVTTGSNTIVAANGFKAA